jgi:streptomycin 6-kinase
VIIPAPLIEACRNSAKREAWLARLPDAVAELERRWSLGLGQPFDNTSYSWTAPARLANGTAAVLKLGMPHLEGEHESAALRLWGGEAIVRLLDADSELGAMLLERCEPGVALWTRPRDEQDAVLAAIMKRLWRAPPDPHPFRHLSEMTAVWRKRTLAHSDQWPDAGLAREGLRLLTELAGRAPGDVLLHTDLHAGNVLSAQREPWLAIDPRPFVGDRAYEATQHLLNSRSQLRADPHGAIRRFAERAELDPDRVLLWTFARAAAGPRNDWGDEALVEIARVIAP